MRKKGIIKGTTARLETPCGPLYCTLNGEDSLVEVLVNLGKTGTCARALLEGLYLVINLALQNKIKFPKSEILEILSIEDIDVTNDDKIKRIRKLWQKSIDPYEIVKVINGISCHQMINIPEHKSCISMLAEEMLARLNEFDQLSKPDSDKEKAPAL